MTLVNRHVILRVKATEMARVGIREHTAKMDRGACKLREKRALDVTSMSVSGSGRERRSALMAEDRIEQHLKRAYGTGLNGH